MVQSSVGLYRFYTRAVREGIRRDQPPPSDERESALATRARPIDRVFFDWRGGRDPGASAYPGEEFREMARLLAGREKAASHAYWSDPAPCSMHIEEVEAIWSAIAERDDWRPFEDKVRAVRRMGEAMGQDAAAA